MFIFAVLIYKNVIFRDEDPEKLIKSDDGSAVAVSGTAPPTMPHVPITTPPPPVMGADMSAQTGYGGYSNWYQVGFEILTQAAAFEGGCIDLKWPDAAKEWWGSSVWGAEKPASIKSEIPFSFLFLFFFFYSFDLMWWSLFSLFLFFYLYLFISTFCVLFFVLLYFYILTSFLFLQWGTV